MAKSNQVKDNPNLEDESSESYSESSSSESSEHESKMSIASSNDPKLQNQIEPDPGFECEEIQDFSAETCVPRSSRVMRNRIDKKDSWTIYNPQKFSTSTKDDESVPGTDEGSIYAEDPIEFVSGEKSKKKHKMISKVSKKKQMKKSAPLSNEKSSDSNSSDFVPIKFEVRHVLDMKERENGLFLLVQYKDIFRHPQKLRWNQRDKLIDVDLALDEFYNRESNFPGKSLKMKKSHNERIKRWEKIHGFSGSYHPKRVEKKAHAANILTEEALNRFTTQNGVSSIRIAAWLATLKLPKKNACLQQILAKPYVRMEKKISVSAEDQNPEGEEENQEEEVVWVEYLEHEYKEEYPDFKYQPDEEMSELEEGVDYFINPLYGSIEKYNSDPAEDLESYDGRICYENRMKFEFLNLNIAYDDVPLFTERNALDAAWTVIEPEIE